MRNLLCLIGRHRWETKERTDTAGEKARYSQCLRCGKQHDLWNGPGRPRPNVIPLG